MNINAINNTNLTNERTSTTSDSQPIFSESISKSYTYNDIFEAASKKYNVPISLLEAVAMTESSFNSDSVSCVGAVGLMQLMPSTAESLGVEDSYNPVDNIMGGAKYLSQLLDKYNGDTDLALAAYNGGMGNVSKYNGIPPFCQSYVDKVNSYISQGVTSPYKTVEVSPLSRAGALMADATSAISDSVDESGVLNSSTYSATTNDNLSNTDIINTIYINESQNIKAQKLDMLRVLLEEVSEYNIALSLLDNTDNKTVI